VAAISDTMKSRRQPWRGQDCVPGVRPAVRHGGMPLSESSPARGHLPMKALTLMRCAVGLAMVLAWSLRVLAVPVISSVQLDPEPFRQGAAFSVRVEGTDLAAGTGFLDLRPTVTRVIRFTFAQDNGAWVGAGRVPADLGLQGETTATLNLTFTGSTGQRTLRTLNVRIVADGDTSPPEVAISEPPEGAIFAASPIEVTGTASADATEVTVNGVLATLAGDG